MEYVFIFIFVMIVVFVFGAIDSNEKRRKERAAASLATEEKEGNTYDDDEEFDDTVIRKVMSIGNATVTVSAVDPEPNPLPIQPRKYSKTNSEFNVFGDDFRGYYMGLKNENMKPKEIDFKVDSLETALALAEELHRYRAKVNDDPSYKDVFDGGLPRNPIKYFQLRGLEYRRPKARRIYDALLEGEKVLLIKEPTNPYDGNAVMVYATNGEHLGYVPKEMAKAVGKMFHTVGYAWAHRSNGINLCEFLLFLNYMEYDEQSDHYPYTDPEERFTEH